MKFNMHNIDSYGDPSIMEPLDSLTTIKTEISDAIKPDLVNDAEFNSIPILPPDQTALHSLHSSNGKMKLSFHLMGRDENLLITTEEEFYNKLRCTENDKIKVVTIFGNTGDGKSHTMNHIFFDGEEIFKTSSDQTSCTVGVMAAMQRRMGVLCIDTEGFLGTNSNPDRIKRMLLKILAISDIIIFRTRCERLRRDMYQFLDTASKAFHRHFTSALQSLDVSESPRSLGPGIIIFHETRYTKPLESTLSESVEDQIRTNFRKLNMNIDSFSSLQYIGIQTEGTKSTNYKRIKDVIKAEIANTTVRSHRQPKVIFKAIRALNLKFSGEIADRDINPFPEQYFSCNNKCESCDKRCERSMGHLNDGEEHENSQLCVYQHQLDNKVYLCKKCHKNGKKVIVTSNLQSSTESSWTGLAKYAWKGAVIECPNCGEIYRSRQYWYGNKSPEDIAVRSEIVHVWKGRSIKSKDEVPSGQILLDSVNYISGAIGNVVQQPTKAITDWVADKTAPSYWIPNSEIMHCHNCRKNFEKTGLLKHHCRCCGQGFCHNCSKHKMPVPHRGWGDVNVRVCDECRQQLIKGDSKISNSQNGDENDITVRKYGESVISALSQVAVVLEYPKDFIKDSARPSYWVKDSDAPNCAICKILFGTAEELEKFAKNCQNAEKPVRQIPGNNWRHHCRQCGEAVCDNCSMNRRPVPERNWPGDVRVCDVCYKEKAKMN
ncbi:zinc finger FYVE domain-containing protein 1-like isoform X2 [Condylostylus longicornis]|uniref:zinc finger FYVE domain-containing protein 1-like isoform X2 n=1 Tax=Condylostylus longicornis TaxID=2530218 RepID=UPI00244DB716|nr:zinc finger FYVE domain-containing protein 1-like isoform X2 [Condylostylus longicornis]